MKESSLEIGLAQELSAKSLDNINFEETNTSIAEEEKSIESEGTVKFSFSNQELPLRATKTEVVDNESNITQEIYEFFITFENAEINASLSIYHNLAPPTVEVTIIKNDNEQKLPKGLGIHLYKILINWIQHLVNQKKQDLLHSVTRATSISETPMSEEKWDRLFLPILEASGYSKDPDGEYSKQYRPSS